MFYSSWQLIYLQEQAMKKVRIFTAILLSTWAVATAYADTTSNTPKVADASKSSPLAGGINARTLQACIKTLNDSCKQSNWLERDQCVEKNITLQKHCEKMVPIYKIMNMLPQSVKGYGKVTLVTFFHPGDGQYTYDMIDYAGTVVNLATEKTVGIAQDPKIIAFMTQNPQGGLMPLVSTDKQHTPSKVRKTADGGREFIFDQLLKKKACLACESGGVAEVAYDFDAKGIYQSAKLVQIKQDK